MSITQKDIKLLWGRSGSRCAICQTELSHDAANNASNYLIGEQAHIIGEKEDAARGKSSMSLDDRNSYHNLILLCPNHHTEIDKNVVDWSVERLYQTKSKHELWVRESLSATVDLRYRAGELIVSSVIDSVVTNCHLDRWSGWTSFALAPDPNWPDELSRNLYTLVQKLIAVIWPPEFDELRRSAISLARLTHKACEKFHEHSEKRDDTWIPIKFYKEGGFNHNYRQDLKRYTDWLEDCYELIREATKAANWFADVVRRDINPLFYATQGRFLIVEGPFMDMSFKTQLLQFTDEEKACLPDAIYRRTK